MTLDVHVLGPGYGESIVLHFFPGEPGEGVGVIDDCGDRNGRSLIPDFLDHRLKTNKIEFLAITHPHADHCLGVGDVFARCDVNELWLFDSLSDRLIFHHYKYQTELNERDPVAAALNLNLGALPLAICTLLDEVQRRRGTGTFCYLRAPFQRQLFDGRVCVNCLTPVDQTVDACRERLRAAIQASEERLRGIPGARTSQPWDPNLASTAFLITYGQTRVLLLADALESMWRDWSDTWHPAALPAGPVHFVKAGHHGSETGYHEALFSSPFLPTVQTIAVITPFVSGSVRLPKREGSTLLSAAVPHLYCTDGVRARETAGEGWVLSGPAAPDLPLSWMNDVVQNPQLRELLVPPYSTLPALPDGLALPYSWACDVQRSPALGRYLRPGAPPGAPPHDLRMDDFRISVRFDASGNSTILHKGAQVGVLNLPRPVRRKSTANAADDDCA